MPNICNTPGWPVELDELKRQSPKAGRLRRPFRPGDGAHYYFNGDSYPVTVRRVSRTGHQVWVTHDVTKAPNLFVPLSAKEVARLFADPDGYEARRKLRKFTRRKDGRYFNRGTWVLGHGREHQWSREF